MSSKYQPAQPTPPRRLRLTGAAGVVTGEGPLRGPLTRWEQVGLRAGVDLVVELSGGGQGWPRIAWIGPRDAAGRPACDAVADLGGRLLLPGLIDAHTHAVFAGDRAGEFGRRMSGASYAELSAEGGGILTTVRATRRAGPEALAEACAGRLAQMAAHGVRIVEIKTGYGLSLAAELEQLAALERLAVRFAGELLIVPTAMPAHAVPPEFAGRTDDYVERVCAEILPAMAARPFAPAFVDVFVEEGYFGLRHARRIAAAAASLGLPLKAHVDEFEELGGVGFAVGAGAISVEHLLATSPPSVRRLAASETVAVCLPLTSLFLRQGYAPMRALVDAGALVAVATDCNPGSAMTTNLPLAMQVAVLNGRLSPQESLRGATTVAARAVGCPEGYGGRLRAGGPLIATLLDVEHPDAIFYELGAPPRARPLPRP